MSWYTQPAVFADLLSHSVLQNLPVFGKRFHTPFAVYSRIVEFLFHQSVNKRDVLPDGFVEQFLITAATKIKYTELMKKSLIICVLAALSTVAFAQSTTSSTNPKQTAGDTRAEKNTTGGGLSTNATDPANKGKAQQPAAAGTKNNGAVKPKSGAGTSAGTGGQAQSAQGGVQGGKINNGAVSQGAINKTQPDAAVKKGSGASPRNRKNHTGKTGNYKNEW
jgi:hypothetical protein